MSKRARPAYGSKYASNERRCNIRHEKQAYFQTPRLALAHAVSEQSDLESEKLHVIFLLVYLEINEPLNVTLIRKLEAVAIRNERRNTMHASWHETRDAFHADLRINRL